MAIAHLTLQVLLFAASAIAAEFEVAAIHPARPANGGVIAPTRVQFTVEYSADGVRFVNYSVRDLIQEAYALAPRRVESTAKELDPVLNRRFDITAKAAGPASRSELRGMLQRLLADRFGLRFHRDVRQEEVYRLVTRRDGVVPPKGAATELNPHYQRRGDRLWYVDAVPADFGEIISVYMQRKVLDATGLPGIYDFPISSQARATDEGRDAVIDELQRIGLDLVRGSGDIEYVIVEHVEEPSEN